MLEYRISHLETHTKEIRTETKEIRSDLSSVLRELAEIKGKLSHLPTSWQLITVFAAQIITFVGVLIAVSRIVK